MDASIALPCPFCGKKAAVDTLNYTSGKAAMFRAQCRWCKAATAWYAAEEEAWKAWNARKANGANILFNKDAFVLNGLFYSRNRLTGNCSAQKEFRGKAVRIKEDAFLAAYEECKKTADEDING